MFFLDVWYFRCFLGPEILHCFCRDQKRWIYRLCFCWFSIMTTLKSNVNPSLDKFRIFFCCNILNCLKWELPVKQHEGWSTKGCQQLWASIQIPSKDGMYDCQPCHGTSWPKKWGKTLRNTSTKFNIAPEKWWLEYYFPFWKAYFQGLC